MTASIPPVLIDGAWEDAFIFIFPQIVYDKLDVFYLTWSQPGYIKYLRRFRFLFRYIPPQQIIGADMEKVRNSYQYVYRQHNVVVFTITYTLLFYTQFLGKLDRS